MPSKHKCPAAVGAALKAHRGTIVNRTLHFWRALPPRVQCTYEVEDMIADVMVGVCRKYHTFDPKKSSVHTWVYRVATCVCMDIMDYHTNHIRNAPVASLGSEDYDQSSDPALTDHRLQEADIVNAKSVFERILQFSSASVSDLLDSVFFKRVTRTPTDAELDELRALVAQHNAVPEDFRIVSRYLIA